MIKAIATDMDGTFLNSQSTYDQARFLTVYAELKRRGIAFIVASGNPVYQLQKTFAPVKDELVYVAENGVELVEGGQDVLVGQIAPAAVTGIVAEIALIKGSRIILSGRHQGYALGKLPAAFRTIAEWHYPGVKEVASLAEVVDPIVKIMLDVPGELTQPLMDQINHDYAGELTAVSSGYGNLDLIVAGMDKAAGLKHYLAHHQLEPAELMAFGDGQNDLTMLQLAGESYAMANGIDAVKQAAKYQTRSNDENGVLVAIEKMLAQN